MNDLKHFMIFYMGFGKWIDKLCWAGFGKVGMLLAGMLLLALSRCIQLPTCGQELPTDQLTKIKSALDGAPVRPFSAPNMLSRHKAVQCPWPVMAHDGPCKKGVGLRFLVRACARRLLWHPPEFAIESLSQRSGYRGWPFLPGLGEEE